MNPESDQFEQLRRLIALKRHEQPPPGYFRTFSHTVIARIEAGEGRMLEGQMSWLRRFWIALETKPVYAGAFGVAICSLLVSGVVYSSRVEEIDPGATAVIQAPTANARVQVMNSAPFGVGLQRIAVPQTPPNGGVVPPHATPSLFGPEGSSLFQRQGLVQPASLTLQ